MKIHSGVVLLCTITFNILGMDTNLLGSDPEIREKLDKLITINNQLRQAQQHSSDYTSLIEKRSAIENQISRYDRGVFFEFKGVEMMIHYILDETISSDILDFVGSRYCRYNVHWGLGQGLYNQEQLQEKRSECLNLQEKWKQNPHMLDTPKRAELVRILQEALSGYVKEELYAVKD